MLPLDYMRRTQCVTHSRHLSQLKWRQVLSEETRVTSRDWRPSHHNWHWSFDGKLGLRNGYSWWIAISNDDAAGPVGPSNFSFHLRSKTVNQIQLSLEMTWPFLRSCKIKMLNVGTRTPRSDATIAVLKRS